MNLRQVTLGSWADSESCPLIAFTVSRVKCLSQRRKLADKSQCLKQHALIHPDCTFEEKNLQGSLVSRFFLMEETYRVKKIGKHDNPCCWNWSQNHFVCQILQHPLAVLLLIWVGDPDPQTACIVKLSPMTLDCAFTSSMRQGRTKRHLDISWILNIVLSFPVVKKQPLKDVSPPCFSADF